MCSFDYIFHALCTLLDVDNTANLSVALLEPQHRENNPQRGADCFNASIYNDENTHKHTQTHTLPPGQPRWISIITSGPMLSKSRPYFFSS